MAFRCGKPPGLGLLLQRPQETNTAYRVMVAVGRLALARGRFGAMGLCQGHWRRSSDHASPLPFRLSPLHRTPLHPQARSPFLIPSGIIPLIAPPCLPQAAPRVRLALGQGLQSDSATSLNIHHNSICTECSWPHWGTYPQSGPPWVIRYYPSDSLQLHTQILLKLCRLLTAEERTKKGTRTQASSPH